MEERFKRFKAQMGTADTGRARAVKSGHVLLGLWILCIIGVIAYFTRPVTGQK